MKKEQLYSIQKFAELTGKSAQTLRNWDKAGKLKPYSKGFNGYRYYLPTQVDEVYGLQKEPLKKIIGYCRVSSAKQKDDLNRQEECLQTYLLTKGMPFEIISDIGSGINYKKKGLQELIMLIIQHKVSLIVVLYKDRLVRFGFDLLEFIASQYGCSIEIIDSTLKTPQEEMTEDLIQIITVFSCRLQGQRSGKAKKLIQELLNADNNPES